MSIVHVRSHERDGYHVSAYDRAAPGCGVKLNRTLNRSVADPDDVMAVKKALMHWGYYEPMPDIGLNEYPDEQMFAAITRFQEDNGLSADGTMMPGGETEKSFNEAYQRGTAFVDNPKDREIINRMFPIIKGHEGNIGHPYKDSNGYITVGVGTQIDDWATFSSVNWTDEQKRPVSKKEVHDGYKALKNNTYQNYRAKAFEGVTKLRISEAESIRLFERHIKKDLSHIRKTDFTQFDRLPVGLQNVLVDIKYNTGSISEKDWPSLHRAIKDKDLSLIAKHVHRKDGDVKKDRNKWATDSILEIKHLDY